MKTFDNIMTSVLIVTPRFPPALGGAEYVVEKISQYLAKSYSINVLTSNAIEFKQYNTNPRGQFFYLTKKNNLNIFSFRPIKQSNKFILRILRSIGNTRSYKVVPKRVMFQPDFLLSLSAFQPPFQFYYTMKQLASNSNIIHTFAFSFFSNYLAFLSSKSLEIPLFVTPFYHLDIYRFGRMNRSILKHAERVFALTNFEKQFICKNYDISPKKIVVTGVGIDLDKYKQGDADRFRTTYKIPKSNKIVLYMANQTKTKGLSVVLDAMKQVWDSNKEVTLVVAGQCFPETNKIWRVLSPSEYQKTVRINYHWGNDPIKHDALEAACCLVVPSVKESFGIIYLEAWAHKKPFIAVSIPQIASYATHKRNALLLKKGNSIELSNMILKMMENPEFCNQLGENGYKKLYKQFTWKSIADKVYQEYQRFLS